MGGGPDYGGACARCNQKSFKNGRDGRRRAGPRRGANSGSYFDRLYRLFQICACWNDGRARVLTIGFAPMVGTLQQRDPSRRRRITHSIGVLALVVVPMLTLAAPMQRDQRLVAVADAVE